MQEFVTFIVGTNKTKFLIHKSFACAYSPVLKAAFNNTFVEGQTQTYKLEETTEGAFGLLSQWIYTQKLDGDLGGKEKAGPNLYRLWILAEKLLMPRLQNLAIDHIEADHVKYRVIFVPEFEYVWENTTVDSPLRRLLAYQCAWSLRKEAYLIHQGNFPKEAMTEICFLFRDNYEKETKYSNGTTAFHVKES